MPKIYTRTKLKSLFWMRLYNYCKKHNICLQLDYITFSRLIEASCQRCGYADKRCNSLEIIDTLKPINIDNVRTICAACKLKLLPYD